MLMDLDKQGKRVIITGLQKQPRYMMERVDLIPNLITADQLSEGFMECILSLKGTLNLETAEQES